MVTEPRDVSRSRDTRNGHGVAGRFRPLGTSDEGPDPSPPEFATGPWGYRRAEVDAWASWVAGLVAHGRNETVRADSAEATLRATLDRLERVERSGPSGTTGDLPRRTPPGADGPGTTAEEPRARTADRRPLPHRTASITRVVADPDPVAATPSAGGEPGVAPEPTDPRADPCSPRPDTRRPSAGGPACSAAPPPPDPGAAGDPTAGHATAPPGTSGPATGQGTGGGDETAGRQPPDATPPAPGPSDGLRSDNAVRLQIVETTLCEVMRLLHRLVGPEASTQAREPSQADP